MLMKRNRNRKVMLTLDEDLYFRIRKQAEQAHIPVATYIKVYLAKLMEEVNYGE